MLKKNKKKKLEIKLNHIIIMETLEYFVESIVEKRVKFGKVEYLLKWKGFSEYIFHIFNKYFI